MMRLGIKTYIKVPQHLAKDKTHFSVRETALNKRHDSKGGNKRTQS